MSWQHQLIKAGISSFSHFPQLIATVEKYNFTELAYNYKDEIAKGLPLLLSLWSRKVIITVPTVEEAIVMSQWSNKNGISAGYADIDKADYTISSQIIYSTSAFVTDSLLSYNSGDPGLLDNIDFIIMNDLYDNQYYPMLNYQLLKNLTNSEFHVLLLKIPGVIPNFSFHPDYRYNIQSKAGTVVSVYSPINYSLTDSNVVVEAARLVNQIDDKVSGDIVVYLPEQSDLYTFTSNLSDQPKTKMTGIASSIIDEPELTISQHKIVVITGQINPLAFTDRTKVKVIIDTMLHIQPTTLSSGGLRQQVNHISQNISELHKSVVSDGTYYALCTSKYYHTLPFIYEQKYSWSSILLELFTSNISINQLFPDHDTTYYTKLLTRLKVINGTTIVQPEVAKLILYLPLSPVNSTILHNWLQTDQSPYWGAVLTTLVDSYDPSYYDYPILSEPGPETDYRETIINFRRNNYQKFTGYSDLHTMINLWNYMLQSIQDDGHNVNNLDSFDLSQFVKNNHLHHSYLKAVQTFLRVKTLLGLIMGQSVQYQPANAEVLIDNYRIISKNYYTIFQRKSLHSPYYIAPGYPDIKYMLDMNDSVNQLGPDYPSQILPLLIDKSLNIIKVALDA